MNDGIAINKDWKRLVKIGPRIDLWSIRLEQSMILTTKGSTTVKFFGTQRNMGLERKLHFLR